jgi:ribose transport system ATP-binding protein
MHGATAKRSSPMTSLLELRNVSKTFASQVALDGVDLDIRPGEVHALVGKNGSGKSTLAKVLSGFHAPDHGAKGSLLGKEVTFPLGADERRMLHFVHQDLGLVDAISIIDNIGLSDSYRLRRFHNIDWKHSRDRARRALAPFGLSHLDLNVSVAQLTASERAVTAIARGLLGWDDESGVLVLDETTAALPPKEVHVLTDAMQQVVQRGAGILYITHRLDEVFSFAHRVSILRDGRLIGTYDTAALSQEELVTLMVGQRRSIPATKPVVKDTVALRCKDLVGQGLNGLNLTVHVGEIVGVAGILGSGREVLADVIFGGRPLRSGTIETQGIVTRKPSPHDSLAHGIVLVPSDRKRRGILPELSVRENITLPHLSSVWKNGFLRRDLERSDVLNWIRSVDLVPPDPEHPMGTLSGGNQQKAILARALRMQPRVLLLDEATQGVDIGAKRSIHDLIRGAAADGMGVLFCTAEPEDLTSLCHRVVMMHNGAVAAELTGGELTQENIFSIFEGEE